MRAMHQRGLRLDDAATAADVAVLHLRDLRDRLIVSARAAGLSYRQIARMVGIDAARVHRICSALTDAAGQSTPDDLTL